MDLRESAGKNRRSLYKIPEFLEILPAILLTCKLNLSFSSITTPKKSTDERFSRGVPLIATSPRLLGGAEFEKYKKEFFEILMDSLFDEHQEQNC